MYQEYAHYDDLVIEEFDRAYRRKCREFSDDHYRAAIAEFRDEVRRLSQDRLDNAYPGPRNGPSEREFLYRFWAKLLGKRKFSIAKFFEMYFEIQ